MFYFSKKSKANLESVHQDLQTLFQTVIKYRNCTITAGLRTQEEQQELYAQGRSKPGNIVTFKDGVQRRSKHQTGNAVDVVPYPEMWDETTLTEFGNFVKGIAVMLKSYGAIDHDVKWGGDWENFKDKPHWEI